MLQKAEEDDTQNWKPNSTHQAKVVRSPLDAVHAAIVVRVFMDLSRNRTFMYISTRIRSKQYKYARERWALRNIPFCKNEKSVQQSRCCWIHVLWLQDSWASWFCNVLIVHSTRPPLSTGPDSPAISGLFCHRSRRPECFQTCWKLDYRLPDFRALILEVLGVHLGWAQATCQTGPSCPTRLAARLWVPSFTSKILTDRSLEETNINEHSCSRAAPGAGGKASAIEIHLSIVDHVLVPRVHGGLNRHHLHSARCVQTEESQLPSPA